MMKNGKVKSIKIKMSMEEKIYQAAIAAFVGIVVLLCLIPFLYVVGMSFTSEGEMIAKNYFVIFPEKPILSAYKYILENANFFSGMKVTILRTVLGVGTALILTLPVGYILAIRKLPGKNGVMVFFIITMILNGGLIPTYILYRDLHLLNSFWVYIAPSLANTFGILVVKLFVEGIPTDVMESADLDGASELQKLWYIGMPLLKPTICALGLFAAVTHWNSWMDAMIYVKDANIWPIQYIIRNLLTQGNNADLMNNISTYAKMTSESMKMASVIVAVLPILCVYPFLQKYFVHGMFTGSVKG
ncbi:MAG: carbohydrate ABC transporter permease [Oliverpabstia sp.]|nr:carbohydrate ABC transporter permease [Oliverpabstia sp.]